MFSILLIVVSVVQADPIEKKKPVICDETKKIYEELVNGEYAEMPVWGGHGEKSNFVLLVNKETGTWTLLEFNKDTSCILGVGEGSRALGFGKPKTTL